MTRIAPGRFTSEIDGDFVVFVIGMRFNKPWKVHRWLPIASAMPRMLAELRRSPIKGLLGVVQAQSGLTTVMIQYWRSYDDLEHFARDPGDLHLPAWRRYNRAVGSSGDVGVYHETYRVRSGEYETVYVNMPAWGLGRAGEHVPVEQRGDTSRERITAG